MSGHAEIVGYVVAGIIAGVLCGLMDFRYWQGRVPSLVRNHRRRYVNGAVLVAVACAVLWPILLPITYLNTERAICGIFRQRTARNQARRRAGGCDE